jgi:hypothetical protein
MKKTLLFLTLISLMVFAGCNKEKEQKLREQHLKDSFGALLNSKSQEVETLFSQLNDIDENLTQITNQYASLNKEANTGSDVSKDKAHHIGQQINIINDLLAQNREKIAKINRQIASNKGSQKENKELKAYVENLNKKINEQQQQIDSLTKQLQDKNIQIDNLNKNIAQLTTDNKTKDAKITKVEDERYTGYFIVGTKRELMNANLVNSKGGFIGIGKTSTVNGEMQMEAMTKIDIRNVSEIPLTGNKITIITPHPSSSYALEGNQNKPTSLKIVSPNSFWQTSKCLIIMTK